MVNNILLDNKSFSKLRSLVVEDNQLIQLIHKKMLIDIGYQVDVASSGEQALLMLKNNYDLILLDIGLPGISGIEVAKKFSYCKNLTKIIALTAHAYDSIVKDCVVSGIDQVLTKPITTQKLIESINKFN